MARKQIKLWTTEDGRRIRICDMSDNHLSNTIAMLERTRPTIEAEYIDDATRAICNLHGEMAIYSIECDMNRIMAHGLSPQEIHPLYPNLLLDQERRTKMEESKDYKVTHEFFVAGVRFHQLNSVINDIAEGDYLALVPEPSNKFDPNAIKIMYFPDVMLGYVPKKFSSEVSAMIEVGKDFRCAVAKLNKNAKPWEKLKVEIREVL